MKIHPPVVEPMVAPLEDMVKTPSEGVSVIDETPTERMQIARATSRPAEVLAMAAQVEDAAITHFT